MTFNEFVRLQLHRADAVGSLAEHAAADSSWPADAAYPDLLAHLVETRALDRIPALHAAKGEFVKLQLQ